MKKIAICLLGEESYPLWLTEFYGENEQKMAQTALEKATNYQTVAYLDPFENLRTQTQLPDLILKPNSLEQAISMGLAMIKTRVVNLVIIDSLFLLPSDKPKLEKSLVTLVKSAEENTKPVFLLNPDNGSRELLKKSLRSFCSSQIRVS